MLSSALFQEAASKAECRYSDEALSILRLQHNLPPQLLFFKRLSPTYKMFRFGDKSARHVCSVSGPSMVALRWSALRSE